MQNPSSEATMFLSLSRNLDVNGSRPRSQKISACHDHKESYYGQFSHQFLFKSILMTISRLCLALPGGLFTSALWRKFNNAYICHMPHPLLPEWMNDRKNTRWGVYIGEVTSNSLSMILCNTPGYLLSLVSDKKIYAHVKQYAKL